MKRLLVFMIMIIAMIPAWGATDHLLVSAAEATDFIHAAGWVFTFNFFFVGILFFPSIGKRIIHLSFAAFLPIAAWVAYEIIRCYELSMESEIALAAFCFLPAVGVYGYSAFLMSKYPQTGQHVRKNVYISAWSVSARYAITSKLPYLIKPFVLLWVYAWSQTPLERRKKKFRKYGWDVDHPEPVQGYLVLHRRNNPMLTCAVSRKWKRMPISMTRNLGLLSKETQHEIELMLECFKLDFAKQCEREHILLDEPLMVVGNRTYTPRDMLSRIERKTPLGMRFLRKRMQETIEKCPQARLLH